MPRRVAAAWGLGTFATTTMLNGVSVVLLYFLVNFLKVEPVVAGALLFGSKLLDVVTDPPMGLISDRTRSRWGKRRPYLLGSSLFCGLSFALLFNVPGELAGGGLYAWLAGLLALYALSYTAFQVPYMAMPAEMTDDYHERTRVMGWRVLFMTLGNFTGSAVVPALVAVFGKDRAAYGDMGLLIGGLIMLAMLLCFAGTAGARMTPTESHPQALRWHLRRLAANRPLLVLIGMKILIYVGISAFVSVMLFFLASVLKTGPEALAVYGATQTLATIASIPLCARLSRRIGKRMAYLICLVGFVLTLATWVFAVPGEALWAIGLRGAVLGVFAAGNFLYGNSMLLDAFAWDYQQTGVRREGVLSAAFSFCEKASLAFGPLIIGALLSAMGFDKTLPPTAEQPPGAVQAMYLGFIWIPVTCQLAAATLLTAWPLDPQRLRPGGDLRR
ncbi:MAG: MFS transporter [Gammaproteobacteria bacterium]|nr:MAG: MFS transporter [Gammaproteobacteria bacterium]